jgi:hypothetical protein
MDIHERKTAEEALRCTEAYLAEAQRLLFLARKHTRIAERH